MKGPTSRRAAIGAILAAPLASVPTLAAHPAGERAEYRARLLAAYAEDRACYPLLGEAPYGSLQDRAVRLINRKAWDAQGVVSALPPPTTLDGLGLAAMAAAMTYEGETPSDMMDRAAIGLIRAVLSYTGTVMPDGWTGFGDDPEHDARVSRLNAQPGRIASWAVGEAEAMPCA